jgi:hypothetical protein
VIRACLRSRFQPLPVRFFCREIPLYGNEKSVKKRAAFHIRAFLTLFNVTAQVASLETAPDSFLIRIVSAYSVVQRKAVQTGYAYQRV